MRILGINGILNNGEFNTDPAIRMLAERLDGIAVDGAYPLTSLFRARSYRAQIKDARLLISTCPDCDVVVAHSRGPLVNLRMMELGAKFDTVFWFRPAMDRDFVIPKGAVNRLFVIHNPKDWAILFGSLLWRHDFGNAGRFGLYAGQPGHRLYDTRVLNVRAPEFRRHEIWHHSCDFLPGENLTRTVDFMEKELRHG